MSPPRKVEPDTQTVTCPGCNRAVLLLFPMPVGTRTVCHCGEYTFRSPKGDPTQ